MVAECKSLIVQAPLLRQRLMGAHDAMLEQFGSGSELSQLCAANGIKPGNKKLNKILDNFSWNVRLVKGQGELVWRAREESIYHMRQICEAAATTGLKSEPESIAE